MHWDWCPTTDLRMRIAGTKCIPLWMWCFIILITTLTSPSESGEFQEDLPEFLKHLPPYSSKPSMSTPEDTTLRPFIDPVTPTNITVIKGRTAMLACVVRNLGTASVSWMRIVDYNILTMNQLTNTLDPRIKGIHVPGSDLWALRIQDTTLKDDGQYECQITTAQKTIEIVTLNVLDPTTNILGPDEVFLSKGSTLNLTCRITRGPNTQPFIIWTHQSKMLKYISYENEPNALSTNAQGEILTQIVVAETAVGHSGRYRCEPSNAPHAEVLVHVLDGKLPAAMQRAPTSIGLQRPLLAAGLLLSLVTSGRIGNIFPVNWRI